MICAALKRYGMFLADNGSAWFVSGAHDPRWNDSRLGDLKRIPEARSRPSTRAKSSTDEKKGTDLFICPTVEKVSGKCQVET